ncbi:hypothetical protein HYQ46_006247 [Verticillium longisporum]|nr:hypothetical protein HYQ46_006247 [Verticillium longisporum]
MRSGDNQVEAELQQKIASSRQERRNVDLGLGVLGRDRENWSCGCGVGQVEEAGASPAGELVKETLPLKGNIPHVASLTTQHEESLTQAR